MTAGPDLPSAGKGEGFPRVARRQKGYDPAEVDAFLARARAAFEAYGTDAGAQEPLLTASDVRGVAFPLARNGYEIDAVDAALGRVEDAFAEREREVAMGRMGAHAWVARAREDAQVILDRLARPEGKRFARAGWLRFGYRIDEVDIVADKIAEHFASGTPVTPDQVRAVAFRMKRRGYREEQVDALLDAVVEVMLAVR